MLVFLHTRNAFTRRLGVLGRAGVKVWLPPKKVGGLYSTKIGNGEGGSTTDPPKKRKRSPPLVQLSKMGLEDARLELVKLDEELERHALLYYVLDTPEISDAAFDKLVRRAEDLEGKFEALRGTVRHMQRVGYSAAQGSGSKFSPFNHTKPLMSLDNALNREELDKFFTKCSNKLGSPLEGIEYVVEPKIDGLSMALHYRDGNLVGAGTRGDGAVGEDVTANALMIANVPKTLPNPVPSLVEVRGEVYISTADFAQLNEKRRSANLSFHATPRNAAAGSLRQLDTAVVKERNLRFFAYELRGDGLSSQVCSQQQTLEELSKMGFSVAEPWRLFNLPQDSAALHDHLDAAGGALRSKLGFDTDGAVVKLNKFAQREKMGQLARYPHWAVAFKFRAEEAETELLDITVQVGRTGVLTPVAVLRRVLVGGVFVERATLHNEEEVRRLGLRPGLKVRLKRSGDVIPKVVGVSEGQDQSPLSTFDTSLFSLPCTCPVCGSRTEREEGGVLVRCSGGAACSAQAVESIRHFCSRDAADIEGLGAATAEELYSLGLVKSPADVFRLRRMDLAVGEAGGSASKGEGDSSKDDSLVLRGRKGWGDRSVNNLLAAIDRRRTLPLHKFVYGLGVRHVGQETAKDIARKFRSFAQLWSYLCSEAEGALPAETTIGETREVGEVLLSIEGVGPKAASALVQLAIDPRSRAVVDALLDEVSVLDHDGPDDPAVAGFDPSSLKGQTVVFTGKLQVMPRKQAEEACVLRGANVGSAVTRETTLLVEGGTAAGASGAQSTKAKKARAQGIKVLAEKEFFELYGIGSTSEPVA